MLNSGSHDDIFTCCRDITSCPWTKQHHLEKCSNPKLRTSTLVNDGTLRSTANFASKLRNVNNVKIADLLEFPVMLLFSSHCSHPKIICRKLQDYENINGGYCFLMTLKISGRIFFPFSPSTLQKHTCMTTFLWSYLLQLVRKSN